jgi:hypothetical protein
MILRLSAIGLARGPLITIAVGHGAVAATATVQGWCPLPMTCDLSSLPSLDGFEVDDIGHSGP